MHKGIFLAALASFSVDRCGSSPAQQETLYLRIERTPCYGRCPTDVVELLPDRTVRYEGKRFVPRLGVYTRKLSPTEYNQIEKTLLAAQFDQYKDEYDNPGISDIPSLKLNYRLNGKEKSITCRAGCPPELPKKIEELRTLLAEQGNFQMEKGPEEENPSSNESQD